MDINMPLETKVNGIRANLEALNVLLTSASQRSSEALLLIEKGERNAAIGTVLGLADLLDEAKSFYGAAITLHRVRQL